MAYVIVAGVLGVIGLICGGLFLRRLLGEITELRRQITRVDRQMRAQRARESFLRQLLLEGDEEHDGDDGPPMRQAAVANGEDFMAEPRPPTADRPVRRKRHLGLYIGGAAAALATFSAAAREAVMAHRNRFTAAVTSAGLTAASVTLVTVPPWSSDADHGPPSSAPTVRPTVYLPQYYTRPPAVSAPPSRAPTRSGSASPSTSVTSAASPSATSTTVTVDTESPPLDADGIPGDTAPGSGVSSLLPGAPGGGPTAPAQLPGQSPPSSASPSGEPPTVQAQADTCVDAVVAPVLASNLCLPSG